MKGSAEYLVHSKADRQLFDLYLLFSSEEACVRAGKLGRYLSYEPGPYHWDLSFLPGRRSRPMKDGASIQRVPEKTPFLRPDVAHMWHKYSSICPFKHHFQTVKSEKGEKILWLHLRQALFPITPHGIGTFGSFFPFASPSYPRKVLPSRKEFSKRRSVCGCKEVAQISALLLNPKVSLGERVYLWTPNSLLQNDDNSPCLVVDSFWMA